MDRARDRAREDRDGAWDAESEQTGDRDDERDWNGPQRLDDGAGADGQRGIEAAAAASPLAPDDLHALLRLALGPTELRAAAARMLAAELSAGFGARSSASRPTLPASRILPPSAVEIGPGAPAPQARHHPARPWLLGAGAALLVLALGGRFGAGPVPNRSEAGGGITLDAPPAAMSPSVASTSSTARKSPAWGGLLSPEGARPAAVAASVTAGVPAAEAAVILATPEALASLSSTPTAAGDLALGSMATPPVPPAAPTDASLGYVPGAPCGSRVPGAIGATEAEAALDRFVTVEFAVRGSKDTGKVTFLNSQVPYQGRFYVALFPDLYPAFPPSPAESLRGRCVLVQGRVEAYRGVPQIVLRQAGDLKDLGSAEEGAATVGRP